MLYFHTDPALALEWVTRLGHDLQDADCPRSPPAGPHAAPLASHQIAASHQAQVSNGPTEAVNNLIKRIAPWVRAQAAGAVGGARCRLSASDEWRRSRVARARARGLLAADP